MARNWQDVFQDGQGFSKRTISQLAGIEVDLATALAYVSGGSLPAVKYRLVSDGTTVTAYDQTGAVVSTGTDGGAVLQACLPANGGSGATIDFRNDGHVFPWGSVPGIAPNTTGKVYIRGNGVTVQLSTGGPRFLDLLRVADYDTFQNIEVVDFWVDGNSIDDGLASHVAIGTNRGDSINSQRINVADVTVRRVRLFNVPASSSGKRGFQFNTKHLAGGEATQTSLRNILLEDCSVDGGITGFIVQGSGSTATTNFNIYYDNVRFVRCQHTQSSQTPTPIAGANFQIGSTAPGGYCQIKDCYGEYSSDAGVEIDNATVADVEGVRIYNGKSGFLATNFAAPLYPDQQRINFRSCHVRVTDAAVASANVGFHIDPNNSLAFGTLTLEDCTFFQNNNVAALGGNGPQPFYVSSTSTVRRINLIRFKVAIDSIAYTAGATTMRTVLLQNITGGNTTVVIRDLEVRMNGSQSGSGAISWDCVAVRGSTLKLHIDGIDVDFNVTGLGAANHTNVVNLNPASATTVSGSIRRIRIISLADDTGARTIRVGSTTNLTVGGALTVEDCDFSGMANAKELIVDSTQTALGAVVTKGNRWFTKPAPVALTGLTTATGKKLGAASASVFWRCVVQAAQGSGSAVTAIDYSTDAGTTYTNLVTQSSGALPSGAGPQVGPLSPSDLVKATFTTTQPTLTLVPVDP